MAQGDKRLIFNVRERLVSDDLNRLQAVEAAERAARLRGLYNDVRGDWYSAGGLQTPITSSSPSLAGDVYSGLMVQPDNAGYFLIQPGVAGFLEPSGVGVDDNPYRLVNDPGVVTPAALPFTSNAGGGSPRWDVVECQPVDTVLTQESRFIFNPATGIASSILVDKVKAGRLTYRVRTGTVGGGFPGLAAGWMPLAVVCAPAGSSSLLTSDVWDVRPLVSERTPEFYSVDSVTGVGTSPIRAAEYRFRIAAAAGTNQWLGSSESVFNGYRVGGRLIRSTPSTLAQFGSTADTGGRAALVNADLADNRSTFALAANALVNLVALFPAGLPRWQRYSQIPVGSGRVPDGPRGILVATTLTPNAGGIFTAVPLPTAAAFGATTAPGCLVASALCDSGAVLVPGMATKAEHYIRSSSVLSATIAGQTGFWDITSNSRWPLSARRVLCRFFLRSDNTGGAISTSVSGTVLQGTEALCKFFEGYLPTPVSATSDYGFTAWVPVLPRTAPGSTGLAGTFRIQVFTNIVGTFSAAQLEVLAWSSSDR